MFVEMEFHTTGFQPGVGACEGDGARQEVSDGVARLLVMSEPIKFLRAIARAVVDRSRLALTVPCHPGHGLAIDGGVCKHPQALAECATQRIRALGRDLQFGVTVRPVPTGAGSTLSCDIASEQCPQTSGSVLNSNRSLGSMES